MSHEMPHEPSQSATKPPERPALRSVLMNEITQVMMIDKKNGNTKRR